MGDTSWKAFERRMCGDVGTTRIPCTGERDGADGSNAMFCFQFKLRGSLPLRVWTWLDGIVAHAGRRGKVGVLVLKRPRQRDSEALVVLRWADWLDLHGAIPDDQSTLADSDGH